MEDYLQGFGTVHGNLQSSTIFITEEGEARFIDPIITFRGESSFTRALKGNHSICLPPELLDCLRRSEHYPKYDKVKAESWSIGMVLLSCISLKSEEFFYNSKALKLHGNKIKEAVGIYSRSYSELLIGLIETCLDPNPVDRGSINDIKGFLQKRKTVFN